MTRLVLWLAFVLLFCEVALAEIRRTPSAEIGGIAIVVFPGLNQQPLVSIHSDFSRETRIDIPIADAASYLKNFSRKSHGGVLVSLEAKGVELEHYLPVLTAIARNRNLSLSFVNGAAGTQAGSGARPKAPSPAPEKTGPRPYSDPPDTPDLLAAARTDEHARQALADLWRQGLLSPKTRELIVTRHLHFSLCEEFPHDPRHFPILREVKIIAHTDFPFPEEAWIEFGTSIVVGPHAPQLQPYDFGGARSLHNANGRNFGSLGGSFAGAPTARAVIQIRELNRDFKYNETLWIVRQELDPIQLAPRTKSE